MGKSVAESLLQNYWMLSLCLEQAIEQEEWEEVNCLLQRREEILGALERLSPDPCWLPMLRRAQEVEERCYQLLARKQRSLVQEMEQESQQRHCSELYDKPPPDADPRFETEG